MVRLQHPVSRVGGFCYGGGGGSLQPGNYASLAQKMVNEV